MVHPDRARWNEKYKTRGQSAFDRGPSTWLVAQEDLLRRQPKGPALDLACGTGRNAIYLARLGFSVDAQDISDVAIDWLAQRVAEHDLPITPKRRNLQSARLPDARYQVIINISYLERGLFRAIHRALVPGGLLFFKAFVRNSDNPPHATNHRFTLEPGELLDAFADLHVVEYDETSVFVENQDRWRTMARLTARRPGT